jgi:N-acetylglucosaminyldiphosphoundecaprenol N-acetyl-beta-D-mannosaminyltransferase
MPLVWEGRRNGFAEVDRVYGPDLMSAVCRESVVHGWTHFLYGGKMGVAEELSAILQTRFPGIRILGNWYPPFRPLSDEETSSFIGRVHELRPDIIWVGLSTPRQEFFMAEYLSKLDVTLMLGVGAAFDIHTGRMQDAPAWLKKMGLQWLHRLWQEPRRLWKRYFYIVPHFIGLLALQRLGIRKHSIP